MAEWTEEVTHVAGSDLAIIRGGSGKPLLVFHEELGHPGWLSWHEALARDHTLLIPVQPGLGKSAKIDWLRNIHELAIWYSWALREKDLAPIDVIGFSLGGWIAAEIASFNAKLFRRMVLVAPMGIKPPDGEIMDIFSITARTSLNASVYDHDATPEFAKLYGGERTPEQFEAFEDARTENARLAWEPILHNRSLEHLLEGVSGLPTQVIWGREDGVVPVSAAESYRKALHNSDVKVTIFDHCGHRPEIEKSAEFIKLVREFLA
ncbi:MAG TPA: alpha/beta fold hydrolase [Candidatus Binataceae bacterium]|nr:alpha/beta fold hydrolase [Candidatus Binataceae bacterium]